MTPEHQALLNASIDQVIEIEALDGTRFLATPLFVYEGEDNPDVFFLPVERLPDGTLKTAEAGQSILLEDIQAVRKP
ncbi:hypothetical protein SAMN05421771_1542 [Granulicella pectinivorans]|jgi:hypothetical protein|uniref:Uncharacterized protein n=1 Tax=Granulicella pectinivorans TaxID=474950 RepID=A0A1I6LZK7_9BACT|nr:hypothetical protein [Granulicella pectinivorans]SFS08824.1 hypothetical protein SAMN05421771_1542 [Granulicella pectinivorans]